MTPQEEQLLNSLVDRLNQTQLNEKDTDAEALLKERLAGNPDALYMLAQTVLVQNIALDQAKAQISQLQGQLQQQAQQRPAHTTSFLGRLLGERDDPPPQQQSAPAQQQTPAPGYQRVPQQYAPPAPQYPQYGQPQYQQAQYVPGQPSFLSGALQTAAGVAAGALAFEGVESILHGFGHGGYGWGGPGLGGGFGMGERPVEVINNNYYDDAGRGGEHGEHHAGDQAQFNDGGYDPRNNDPADNLRGFDDQNAGSGYDQNAGAANDQNNGAGQDLSAADNVSDFADQASFDDQSGLNDQAMDDGSGFDDSGGGFDDDGGGGGGF